MRVALYKYTISGFVYLGPSICIALPVVTVCRVQAQDTQARELWTRHQMLAHAIFCLLVRVLFLFAGRDQC